MITFDEDKQKLKLEEIKRKEETDLAENLAGRLGVDFVDLNLTPVNTDALRLIAENDARVAKAATFNIIGKKLYVAVLSPENPVSSKIIADLSNKGYEIKIFIATDSGLEKAWKAYGSLSYEAESKIGALDIENEEIIKNLKEIKSLKDVTAKVNEILAGKKGYSTSKILEIIIAGAISIQASDIHLEPEEEYVRLRYRLDGVLSDILSFDKKIFALILSRIKLLSGLKLNIKNEAQDGRFSVKIGEDDIEIRTSILPGAYSESIVLRILDPKSIQVSIEDLGINPILLKILEREMSRPQGMILTTGPTGSGKTTALYAFLRKVHTPEVKIITIEDPIEYHLPGIVQTQTNKEYTFSSGLRSALRQDPDIIMVGEIRDEETAETALNSALTGHLVFSTLHTNNAAGTFPRLIDLKANPKTVTSAINLAMAQRLVRKLCPFCKKEVSLEEKAKEIIEKIIKEMPGKEEVKNTGKIWTAVGCEKCNNTGYKGRIGVYEAILSDENLEKAVLGNPSEREIKNATREQGIPDMREDGVMKVLSGITSLDELQRVVDLEEDF